MTAKTAALNLATTNGPKLLTDSLTTVDGVAAPTDAEAQVFKAAFGTANDARMVDLSNGLPVDPRDRTTTGTLGALNAEVILDVRGMGGCGVDVRGTFTGTVTFAATINGIDWFNVNVVSGASGANWTSAVTATAPGNWLLACAGCVQVRARMTAYTSGTATVVLRASAAPSFTYVVPIASNVGVTGYPTAAASADGLANPTVTKIDVTNLLFNNTTWDRQRGNTAVSVEASSAKTANGNSAAAIINHNARGVQLFVNVTAATGTTPTLAVRVQVQDPVGSGWVDLPGAATASITGTGLTLLTIYPGIAAVANSAINQPLPRNYRLAWTVGGTTPSFTFSVGAQYIL